MVYIKYRLAFVYQLSIGGNNMTKVTLKEFSLIANENEELKERIKVLLVPPKMKIKKILRML